MICVEVRPSLQTRLLIHLGLTFTTVWADSADDKLTMRFFTFFSSHITGYDISCKLSALQTTYMECQNLNFSEKCEKYSNMSLAEIFDLEF